MFKERWMIHTEYEWANFSDGPHFHRIGKYGMKIHRVNPGEILEIEIKTTNPELLRITTERRHNRLSRHGTLLESMPLEEDETDEA